MKPLATSWHDVALAKLTSVMGPSIGAKLASSVLQELGLEAISSVAELRAFAAKLATRGGFASAVAALLTLHAAMYEGQNADLATGRAEPSA